MSKQTDFINKVKDGAISEQLKHGILASLTIAQTAIESGWAIGTVCIQANNLFGILANGWTPPEVYKHSNGMSYRKYANWTESIEDHSRFLTSNPRYAAVIGCKDYKTACNALQVAGYAGDPKTDGKGYAQLLINVIEQNKLTQYDIPVANSPQEVKQAPVVVVKRVKLNEGTWSIFEKADNKSKILAKIYPNELYDVKVCGVWGYITTPYKISGYVDMRAFK